MAVASLGAHVAALGLWSSKSVETGVAPSLLPRSEVEIEMFEPEPEPDYEPRELGSPETAWSPSSSGSLAAPQTAAEANAQAGDTSLGEILQVAGADADRVSSAPAGAAATQPRRLSLDQLGLGQSMVLRPNPVDRRGRAPQKKAPVDYAARLDHGLAAAIARDDQKKGLGPEGPVITQVLASAYRGNLPFNTKARLSVSADDQGNVLSVSVLSSDGAPQEWQQLADDVFAKFAGKRLRAMGKRGYRFTLAVNSRNQLPSGADPGVNVSVLGIPLKKGGGPRSTSISILNPTNPSEVLGLVGDLSDIGATARRVVRAHLESLEILGSPPAPAARATTP